MSILFGILWLVISIGLALFIKGDLLKRTPSHKVGLILIAVSFIFGFGLLVVAITSI